MRYEACEKQSHSIGAARPFGFYMATDAPVPEGMDDLLAAMELPLYIVFDVDESGAIDDFRVVNVREFPVQVLEDL